MFAYDDAVIVSGRTVTSPEVITLAQCEFDFKNNDLVCDPDQKATTVINGLVGITLDKNYYEINSNTKMIKISALRGSFHSPDWNRDLLFSQANLELIHNESSYIRSYTGTKTLGTINYGGIAGEGDTGYTGISYESNISWGVEGQVGTNIGSSIVFGATDQSQAKDQDKISIMRPDKPYLLLDASTLPVDTKTSVGVSV